MLNPIPHSLYSLFRSRSWRWALSLWLIIGPCLTLMAQPKDNSPYSRIGLGEAIQPSLATMGYGGMSAAFIDPLHVNFLNPANHGWMAATAFEAGAYYDHSTIKLGGISSSVTSGNLTHIALAFPIRNPLNDILENKKREWTWGMSFALVPNTVVGYDIRSEAVLPGIDTVLNIFQGTGGTNKFIWGNAWKHKNLSFGINLTFLFGKIDAERRVQFNNLEASYSDLFSDNISIRAFQWSLGAQYRHVIEENATKPDAEKAFVFGLYGNLSSGFSTKSEFLRIRENFTYSPIQIDTLEQGTGVKGDGDLPASITLGVMYEQGQRWRLGVELGLEAWSQYENEAKPDQLRDTYHLAFGVQFTPNAVSYNNYWQRVRLRAGFYHRTDPRLNDLRKTALTLGFGLPVILPRQQTSFVNLGVEIGKYSTDNAIEEPFVKIAVGFTLNDSSWFYKRKFR